MHYIFFSSIFFLFLCIDNQVFACTNYLFTKSTTTDGSTMITYAADSHVLYGELYFTPSRTHTLGSTIDIYEWDTGKYLGKIPQVAKTYSVVGNMNEYQVSIGETTYGGVDTLKHQDNAIMDYGSLMYITLQRAKSAREAIKIMTTLVEEHGYYSTGESFSISDPNEVWILELIGKGNFEKGAVWVARMVPDGYVSGHANQARITHFPQFGKTAMSSRKIDKIFNKNITTVYAKDVISFAKKIGLYPKNAPSKDFSFSDTYAPVDFGAARFCDLRVWTMYNELSNDMDKHFDYVKGNIIYDKYGYAKNRMPLWIKPTKKVSPLDVMQFMRNHLEGTELDMQKDIGAGPFGSPYRWRPLTWKVDGVTYCNERVVATQQTGFSFVAQARNYLPNEIGGILWFSVDDAASSVYFPVYCSVTKVPKKFSVGYGSLMEFKEDAAFWVFNQVSNFAYTRYKFIHPDIVNKQTSLENKYLNEVKYIDSTAKKLYVKSKQKAIEYVTSYTEKTGNSLVAEWKNLYQYLFVKYMDGNIKVAREVPNDHKYITPDLKQPGYEESWYKMIVKESKEKFKVINKSQNN